MSCLICQSPLVDASRRHQKYCSVKCYHVARARQSQIDNPVDLAIKSGETCREIADRMRISPEAVRSRARHRGLQIAPSTVPIAERKPAVKKRGVAKYTARIPGQPSPYEQARELHKAGKSLLVISGLTGLSRAVLAPLLGMQAPPSDCYTGRNQYTGSKLGSHSPVLWGTDTVFEGPIKRRVYRVLHNADLCRSGTAGPVGEYAMGNEWLTTHDFGYAMNNCHGKKSVVVDSTGLVLAKGCSHFYRKDRYDNR